MDTLSHFITPGIVFLLTLVFGFWLSNSGKPYNSILFNIHKLIALGAVVLTAMEISRVFQNTETRLFFIALIIVTGLCIAALFASGALMSLGKLNYTVMLTIHRITPIFAAIAMGATIYYVLST